MTEKRIGIITFHAAHNYGSVLQAYALKRAVYLLSGSSVDIINFRTERQKDQYRPFTKRRKLKYIIKNAYFALNYASRRRKYDKFEDFISKYLISGDREYNSQKDLKDIADYYDYYISGSDQIWNPVPNDYDDAYFLSWVNRGVRIAYAPSFGGKKWEDVHGDVNKLVFFLKQYQHLSIREFDGSGYLKKLLNIDVPVLVDPTLLLMEEDYEPLTEKRLIDGDYIFFYTLFCSKEMIDIVSRFSRTYKIPVVISNVSNQYEIFNSFTKKTDCGPRDFLSLIKYSKLNVVSSFHGVAFSILFNKPFYAIHGLEDPRICTLLNRTGLLDRVVTMDNLDTAIQNSMQIDFVEANSRLDTLREEAFEYLRRALEVNEKDL